MNGNDLRWQRTHEQIKLAFIHELRRKNFNQVTVTSLIKTAKISRRAFYLHYQDKFDLLKQLEQSLVKQLTTAFSVDHRHFLNSFTDKSALWQQNYFFLTNVLTLIDQERPLFKALLSKRGDPQFTEQLWDLTAQELDTRIDLYHAHFTDQIPAKYAQVLIVDGIIGMVKAWIANPHPESVKNFSRILTNSQLVAPLNLISNQ